MKKILAFVLSCLMILTAITPVAFATETAYELSGNGALTIEIEDNVPEDKAAYVFVSDEASGGKMVGSGWGEASYNKFVIPFTVAETGKYDVEFVESKFIAGDGYSRIDAYINNEDNTETKVGFNNNAYPQLDPEFTEKEYQVTTSTGWVGGFGNKMIKQKYTNVELEKGNYNLCIDIQLVGDHTNFAIDYFKFTPIEKWKAPSYELKSDESLTIELEDSVSPEKAAYIFVSDEASAGKMVGSGWGEASYNKFVIPFTVAETGAYDVEFVESKFIAGDGYSRIDAYINNEDNTEIKVGFNNNAYPQLDPEFTEKEYQVTTSTGWVGGFGNKMIKQKFTGVELEKGNYNLCIDIQLVGDHTNFAIDYFKFTPVEKWKAPSYELGDEELTIEVENSIEPDKEIYVLSSADASGGKMVGSGWGGADFTKIVIPVNVTKTGTFDLEFVESFYAAGSFSRIDAYINNKDNTEMILGFNSSAYPQLDPDFVSKEYQVTTASGSVAGFGNKMIKQKYTGIQLEEGEYNLCIDIQLVGDHTNFAIDYFKFTPVIEKVAAVGSTIIEIENHLPAGKDAYILNSSDASGGKFVGSGWGDASVTNFVIPIIIKESGFYDVEFIESNYEAGSFSRIDTYIKNEDMSEMIHGFNMNAYPQLDPEYTSKEYQVTTANGTVVGFGNMLHKQKYTNLYFKAGKINLCIDVHMLGDHTNFAYDCFKFTREDKKVSSVGPTTIEFEDYVTPENAAYVITSADASNGKLVGSEWGSPAYTNITIPVVIDEAGYYDMEFVQSRFIAGDGYSRIDAAIKDSNNGVILFGFNNNAYPQLDPNFESKTYEGFGNSMIKQKYTNIYLEEGKVDLCFDVQLVGDHTNFALDYFKFSTHDEIIVDGDKVSIRMSPNTSLTGRMIVAFYDGNDLSYYKVYNVIDHKKINVDITVTEKFDRAKVFVWDFINELYPRTTAREFNITNKTE